MLRWYEDFSHLGTFAPVKWTRGGPKSRAERPSNNLLSRSQGFVSRSCDFGRCVASIIFN